MKTAVFGQPCKAPVPGTCRICGSKDPDFNLESSLNWADETRTLCALPACVAAARQELTTHPDDAAALQRPYEGKRYGFSPGRGS